MVTLLAALNAIAMEAQHISQFYSLLPGPQETYLVLPQSHSFQYIIEEGDSLSEGGIMPDRCDFAGYVPIMNSSVEGYLSVNSEDSPGGVTILDLHLNELIGKWIVDRSEAIDFSVVGGTARNCSGTVTSWGTVITCEEIRSDDTNNDGYNDLGWAIEIDPSTKKIIDQDGGLIGGDKLWALGNFKHENVVIHPNMQTLYQGVDNATGFLFKFVADQPKELHRGSLYVYKGSKSGSGQWIQIANSNASDQNGTITQCLEVEATIFSGIEDVEINPKDGRIYLAVKNEDKVYRFEDSDPIQGNEVINFETYVGDTLYEISDGNIVLIEPWGTGNDNLVFDDFGNLWVTQDGDNNYVWLVENGHTQQDPRVKIFARTPKGSEPTGITFTPDYRYLFMSIQHPHSGNAVSSQLDAFDDYRSFYKDVVIAIALKENLNHRVTSASSIDPLKIYPNPVDQIIKINAPAHQIEELMIVDSSGRNIQVEVQIDLDGISLHTGSLSNGIYHVILLLNSKWISKRIMVNK